MCEDAEMVLFANLLRPVKGRARIIEAVSKGRASDAYRAAVRSFEWLDESTLLVTGKVRYALEAGGFTEGTVWWLDEFSGGALRRVHGFRRESEARAAYAARRDARTAATQASRRH
jgi:hypothetical protein